MVAHGAQLRTPVRVESYVQPGDEARLFPGSVSYLSLDQVLEVFPDGRITRDRFPAAGRTWRLAKRPGPGGSTVYLAVDDAAASQTTTPSGTPTTGGGGGGLRGPLNSMPAADVLASHDLSDGADDVAPYGGMHRASTMPSNSGRHRGGHNPLATSTPHFTHQHLHPQQQQQQDAMHSLAGWMTGHHSVQGGGGGGGTPRGGAAVFAGDLLCATESAAPMERFKAFVRLFAGLRRTREALGLAHLVMPRGAALADGPSGHCADGWASPEGQELVKHALMVGESLAKFGTADFGERANTSRAITTKDYAKLLMLYIEGCGGLFSDGFIAQLPHWLQDEALTVRTLLDTRCETNALLFGQLVAQVGQEAAPGSGGGAVIFNTSTVTANPTNHMLAAPKTMVNTVANAWSKVKTNRRTQLGAVGAVAVVALWVLKRRLGGGGSRRGGRRGGGDDSDWGGGHHRRSRGGSSMPERLMDERLGVERAAVRYLSACHEELRRAGHNDELLQQDWRLGSLRLAAPMGGPLPPGYEPVDGRYCSLGRFLNVMDDVAMGGRGAGRSAYGGDMERPPAAAAGAAGASGGSGSPRQASG